MQEPEKGLHLPLMSATKIRGLPAKEELGKRELDLSPISLLVSADVRSI